MRAEVPFRHRMLVRLLVGALLIAAGSTAATAWLTARTTASDLRATTARSFSADARVYDAVVGYGSTHRRWDGVDAVVRRLARETDQRIVLTDRARRPLAGPRDAVLPAVASAVIDPLHAEAPVAGSRRGIDPRALGSLRPTARQRAERRAGTVDACVVADRIALRAAGARSTPAPAPVDPTTCATPPSPTVDQSLALGELNAATARCLARRGGRRVTIGFSLDVTATIAELPPTARRCALSSLRTQLRPGVAPPALLFLLPATSRAAGPVIDLSDANRWRVALLAAIVLTLTLAVTTALSVRLTRPVRQLADAVRSSGDRPVPAPVTTRDELGQLAEAFNDLSARRARTDEQRRAMVRDIAHELRGPVTNVRSWLDGAQDGLTSGSELLAILGKEADQLDHIVRDLAVLAAADAGELTLRRSPVDPADVAEQVVGAHRAAAAAADVALELEVDGHPTVSADAVRLRQILTNLVANGLRHTPPGGRVGVHVAAAPGGVAITVSDTGGGIAPKDLPRVFDRFWRADRSRQRATGGSGLGLAIARQLATAHGGTIAASSRLGRGSTFVVRLPAG